MPVIGLLLGRRVSHGLGSRAHIVGGALLIATGAFTVVQALRTSDRSLSTLSPGLGRLLLLAASLSIDNLIVGFALGAYRVSLPVAVIVIAVVSVGLSLIGLEAGDQLGTRVEHNSELFAGIVLICVAATITANLL